MLFINNKYSVIYYNIINRAVNRVLTGYKEKHHIIPKSLGGNNSKENLVNLTAKEHFICHLLLVKITTGKVKSKMVNAAWLMTNKHSKNQDRYIPSSTIYEQVRQHHAEVLSAQNKGINNPMYGKTITDEHRQKLRDAAKLKPKPSKETIEKRANSLRGRKVTDESKLKMSIAWKAKPKVTCVHCGIICPPHLHNRWHGNNCKRYKLLE